jgi:serine/threonine protein kinase
MLPPEVMAREVVQSDADRYVIVEYLAEGGMGAIFLGKKVGMEGFEKEVVLKQLLPEFTSQPEFIDLFLREARLSASLDHANIVNTIDLVAAGDDYFIVMEFVRGGDLRSILRRIKTRGKLIHPAGAMFIAREVLSALAYAHEKKSSDGKALKLIHRDISPSNIMVSGSGEVKLTDFGIAKVSTHKSVFYRVKGKVGYMSPEQAYGDRPLDLRSDLYSLGVCLYEMLSGERLFIADLLTTPDQIYNQPLPALEGRAKMPEGIDEVLVKALAIDPNDRYQTAPELQDALVKVAYERGMIFTPPDLATELKKVCGEDPLTWNQEDDEPLDSDDDRPGGTEVLQSGEGEQFSGVELTSIFTGLPQMLGPEPLNAGQLLQPEADSDAEPTRHVAVDSIQPQPQPQAHQRGNIAFAPTRLAKDPTLPGARSATPASPDFDVSDYEADYRDQPAPDQLTPEYIDAPGPVGHRPPGMPATPEMTSTPGMSAWGDAEEEEPTLALDANNQGDALIQAMAGYQHQELSPMPEHLSPPPRLTPGPVDTHPLDYGEEEHLEPASAPSVPVLHQAQPAHQAHEPQPPVHDEATVELRVAKGRHPSAVRDPAPVPIRPGPGSGIPEPEPGPDPILLTGRVRPTKPAAIPVAPPRRSRHRILILIAVCLLLLSGGAIVVLVGLSGPDLEQGWQRSRGSDAGSGPSATPLTHPPQRSPDLGATAKPARPDAAPPPKSGAGRSLKVESAPPNARVFLDSVFQCKTPCTVEELERNRVYLLSVRQDRYVSWSSLVDMKGKQRVHINAYLSEEPASNTVGYLMIRSRPRADVYVDGKEIGRVTSEGRIPLPPGQYEITLSHPRQVKRLKFLITIHTGQTMALRKDF